MKRLWGRRKGIAGVAALVGVASLGVRTELGWQHHQSTTTSNNRGFLFAREDGASSESTTGKRSLLLRHDKDCVGVGGVGVGVGVGVGDDIDPYSSVGVRFTTRVSTMCAPLSSILSGIGRKRKGYDGDDDCGGVGAGGGFGVGSSSSTNLDVVRPAITSIAIPHGDDELEHMGFTLLGQVVAGAAAGVMEHVCMFPVDTIKTHMQARHVANSTFMGTAKTIVKSQGVGGLYYGMSAVVFGAMPAHSLYFLVYEASRKQMHAHTSWGLSPLSDAVSGALATAAHDAASCPIDVVKQRAQLAQNHESVIKKFKAVYGERGLATFYASYPTTLLMNIPYFSAYSVVYEQLRTLLSPTDGSFSPVSNCVAGGVAGALGAAISNPLDVIKTRLQTQVGASRGSERGFVLVVKDIHAQHGPGGFMHGITARMLYHMPAAAICWMTYEYINHLLGITRVRSLFIADTGDSEHELHHHHHHHQTQPASPSTKEH